PLDAFAKLDGAAPGRRIVGSWRVMVEVVGAHERIPSNRVSLYQRPEQAAHRAHVRVRDKIPNLHHRVHGHKVCPPRAAGCRAPLILAATLSAWPIAATPTSRWRSLLTQWALPISSRSTIQRGKGIVFVLSKA